MSLPMYSIKPLPEFTAWLDGLTDEALRELLRHALNVWRSVWRVTWCPLEREYRNFAFTWVRAGACTLYNAKKVVIVLLTGGSKRTQKTDIKRAKAMASRLD